MGRKRGPRPANIAANGATDIIAQNTIVQKFILAQPASVPGRAAAMGAAYAVEQTAKDIHAANAPVDAKTGRKEKKAPADVGKPQVDRIHKGTVEDPFDMKDKTP